MGSFDEQSIRRIARTVQTVEVLSGDRRDATARRRGRLDEFVYARLTADVEDSDGKEWEEVYRTSEGEWIAVASGKVGTADRAGLAYSLTDSEPSVGATPVVLRRCPIWQESEGEEEGKWLPGWAVVGGSDDPVKWGKIASYTAGSNTVILTPCNAAGTATGEANVAVAITLPLGRTNCSFFAGAVGNVLPYFDQDNVKWLASIPMPYSTTKYDVFSIAATTGQGGFDSVRIK